MGGCASKPNSVEGETPELDVSARTLATATSVDSTPEIVKTIEILTEDKKEEEKIKAEVCTEEVEVKAEVSSEMEPEIIEVEAEKEAPSKKEEEPKDEKKEEVVKFEEKSTETY